MYVIHAWQYFHINNPNFCILPDFYYFCELV